MNGPPRSGRNRAWSDRGHDPRPVSVPFTRDELLDAVPPRNDAEQNR